MKKTCKITSLLLALVMCLSLSIPALAAKSNISTLAMGESETYVLPDGTTIQVSIQPIGRDRTNLIRNGGQAFEGVATQYTTPITYTFKPADGNYFSHQVWNDSTNGTAMTVKITLGADTLPTYNVPAGGEVNISGSTNNGSGLSSTIKTDIKPVDAASVPYAYILNQEWRT